MLATLISDGSYHNGNAGFSFWFISPAKIVEGNGGADASSPCEAELLGLEAGLKILFETHDRKGLAVVVQCDSLMALSAIRKYARKASTASTSINVPLSITLKEYEEKVAKRIADICEDNQLWLKHVKGHSNVKDGRSAINRRMDRFAGSSRELRDVKYTIKDRTQDDKRKNH